MKKEFNKTYKICLSGIFASLIALATYLFKIPIASGQGYIHLGDTFVYFSGCFLGVYGIFASAIGGAVADILSGYAAWAIPTAVIKALCSLPFAFSFKLYKKEFKAVNKYTVFPCVVSGFITVIGYGAVEVFLYSKQAALLDLVWNIIEALASAFLFIVFGCVIDRIKKK